MSDNDNASDNRGSNFRPAESGAFSKEKVIERISAARDEAAQISNRFYVFSLIFSALALVKIAGLDVSVTILGVATDKLTYGLFIFVVTAQMCSVLSTSRTMDSRAFDFQIESFVKIDYPEDFKGVVQTIPNKHEWLTPASSALESAEGHGYKKTFYNFVIGISAIPGVFLVFAPAGLGVFYLLHHETYILDGDKEIQFWAVAISTALTVLWSLAYFALHVITETKQAGGGSGN